ncbi:hypothetical protein PBY51_004036 [Eleginops maclovinus]|uniref:Uncharacterized protein n=1 Tax=Eleginops maclovinus TaxID=56733 RepID=A0AAN7Y214_ELEMC|nr:hypothetical protein PBY51_004036 [Eleginops maclovinus]
MAAETSRCRCANNSCALTRDQSGENRIKWETEAPGQRKWMGGIRANRDVFDWSVFKDWRRRWLQSSGKSEGFI